MNLKRIALITSIPSEDSFLPLHKAIKKYADENFGVQVDLFKNGEFCHVTGYNGGSQIYYKDKRIEPEDYSLVITRFAIKAAHGGDYYVIRHFEGKAIPIVNPPICLLKAKNKFHTLQILADHKIPVTPSIIIRTWEQIKQATSLLGSPPYIVKNCFGAEGRKVLLANNLAQLYSLFDYIWSVDRNEILLLQPYMGNNPVSDIRVVCVNYKVWRCAERIGCKDEFRTNLHTGSKITPIELTSLEKKICERAVRIMGLPIAGIDFIRTKDGPVILEVNGCPGLEGISRAYAKKNIELYPELTALLIDYAKKVGYAEPF